MKKIFTLHYFVYNIKKNKSSDIKVYDSAYQEENIDIFEFLEKAKFQINQEIIDELIEKSKQ